MCMVYFVLGVIAIVMFITDPYTMLGYMVIGIILYFIGVSFKNPENEIIVKKESGVNNDSKQKALDIRNIPAKIKKIVFERDLGACNVCGSNKKLNFNIINSTTNGGKLNDPDNIRIICSECKGFSLGYGHDRKTPEYVKNFIYSRDDYKCVYCDSTSNLCFDHIIPFSLGGSSVDFDNIQLVCQHCNTRKNKNFW